MLDIIQPALDYIRIFLDIIGVLLVLYGALLAVVMIFSIELGWRGKNKFTQYENAKRVFIQKLIFGLDFFVSGDILQLATDPTLSELYVLAGIVAVRTILSYFLSKEVHLYKD